jgi:hypothetical protein
VIIVIRYLSLLTRACPGKPLRESAGGVRLTVIRYVFVLLLGLVFGYVVQSVSFLVRAVDSFDRSSGNAGFTSYGQGVSYVR